MSDDNQLYLPESFTALHVPPGKVKPSIGLRAMAERTVSAFNREYRFPHMTVFADRNKVEKEETFELASAARDRFMFELRMLTPADDETRRALVFDPRFHDTDALIDTVTPDGSSTNSRRLR